MSRTHQSGFTLLEMMIVVAIIALLATIALPSYQDYVRKGRRADAQSFLLEVAARQQHWLVDRRAYSGFVEKAVADGGLGMTAPSNVSTFYDVTMVVDNTAGTPPTFTVTATPKSGNDQAKDKCGALSVNQSGTKTYSGTGTCW